MRDGLEVVDGVIYDPAFTEKDYVNIIVDPSIQNAFAQAYEPEVFYDHPVMQLYQIVDMEQLKPYPGVYSVDLRHNMFEIRVRAADGKIYSMIYKRNHLAAIPKHPFDRDVMLMAKLCIDYKLLKFANGTENLQAYLKNKFGGDVV